MLCDISCKTLFGSKLLHIRLDEVDGFIRLYDGMLYLVLFGPEKYDAIYNRNRYLTSQKSDVTYAIFHNYTKIKIESYNSLPLEKTLTLHNVIILNNSVFNKNKNHYYYNILLEKCSYK